MARSNRGILGYKKDPKHQMLFSFSHRHGDDWPSSDESDSDYRISGSDDSDHAGRYNGKVKDCITKKKETKKQKRLKRNSPCASASREPPVKKQKHSGHGIDAKKFNAVHCCRLPPEIWLDIFKIVVAENDALPFLCRAAKVCRLWWEVASHPSLWRSVDLSYGWIKANDRTLKWLRDNRLQQCQDINLSSWKKLNATTVKILTDGCSQLRSINVSYCQKLTSEAVQIIIHQCPGLIDIDLSFTSSDAVSFSVLKLLIEKHGPQLRSLNFGGNQLKSFLAALNLIIASCPKLEVFDVSNAKFSTGRLMIPIEKFQTGCPRLKSLRLANAGCVAGQASAIEKANSPGFQHLEQLTVAVNSPIYQGVSKDFFKRILKNTFRLRQLDVRGCGHLSRDVMMDLAATDLQQLFCSKCSLLKEQGMDQVVAKWCHSLMEVDISWSNASETQLHFIILALTASMNSNLELISLTGTSVGYEAIRIIRDKCPKLSMLNLTSCRGLPRGMKREFSGKDIKKFLKDMKQ